MTEFESRKIRLGKRHIEDQYDRCNYKIDKIFYQEENFKIYRANGIVKYEIFDTSSVDEGCKSLYFENKLVEIQPLLAEINYLQQSYPGIKLLSFLNSHHERIDSKISHGLFVALTGSPNKESEKHLEISKEILNSAITHLRRTIDFESKLTHLHGGIFAFLILLALIVLSLSRVDHLGERENFFLTVPSDDNSLKESYYKYFMSALLYGTIGGFMSIVVNIKKLKILPDLKPFQLGILRIIIASVSAVIVFFAIRSKFLFNFEINSENLPLLKIIFFAAGFSEDLLTNIVSKLLNQTENPSRVETDDR